MSKNNNVFLEKVKSSLKHATKKIGLYEDLARLKWRVVGLAKNSKRDKYFLIKVLVRKIGGRFSRSDVGRWCRSTASNLSRWFVKRKHNNEFRNFYIRNKWHIKENDVYSVGTISCPSRSIMTVSGNVVYRINNNDFSKKAVLLFDFKKENGVIEKKLSGFVLSSVFGKHFKYLNHNAEDINGSSLKKMHVQELPERIISVDIYVAGVNLQPGDEIQLALEATLKPSGKPKEFLTLEYNPPEVFIHDPQQKRYTTGLTVVSILDEFTNECLRHEVNLIKLSRESWKEQIEENSIDFLLVESCWKGNDGKWGALTRGSGGGSKLSGLLGYCKQQGIPTVFWNKEDPPHYEKFGPIAALFDLVITTDVNMVPRYKADFGIDAHPLSFGAQPKIHNPEPVIPRLHRAVFAGSYYGDKPKRCTDFNEVMGQVELAGVEYDIFDRNYQRNIEKFAFPDRYQANIVGNLPPEDIWKAHKGYKYQINMNSVQNSTTMFARRVYESLASGTPVVSNESAGVRELFGDLVIMPSERSIMEQLKALEADPESYQMLARRGVRAVMRQHTYGHRIQALCSLLGIEVEVDLPKATLAVTANNEADVLRAKQLFEAQTAQRKRLFIELENFDTAYRFLNESTDTITFAMQLAHDFYPDECQFYGGSRVLKHNVHAPLPAEALEDFIYWGEWEQWRVANKEKVRA